MRKTGSVVRFADEVDNSEVLQKLKGAARPTLFVPRAASDGQQPKDPDRPSSWKKPLPHRDSVDSVAAVSEDGSDDLPDLPRTKSQLSMAIANLKRSQSLGEGGINGPMMTTLTNSLGVTSPEIEKEQEALISGVTTKKKTEEEEKLLAMAHRDGVTKAGGVNMPGPMMMMNNTTGSGLGFELGSSYDSPEEPIF